MSAPASLIPELEDVIQHGSYARRAEAVRRIASLFIDGSPAFNNDHVGLFDDVLCRLVVEIETKARAEMSRLLSPVANAPGELMRQLANDDDIAVAEFLTTQAERRLEVVGGADEPRRRPRVYELPGDDTPRPPRTT